IVEGEQVHLRAEAGFDTDAERGHTKIPLGEGLIGRACADRRSVIVEDIETSPDLVNVAWVRAQLLRSAAVLPLTAGERTLGALVLCTRTRHAFSPDEVSVLRALAEQASIALEKARLYQDSQDRRRLT